MLEQKNSAHSALPVQVFAQTAKTEQRVNVNLNLNTVTVGSALLLLTLHSTAAAAAAALAAAAAAAAAAALAAPAPAPAAAPAGTAVLLLLYSESCPKFPVAYGSRITCGSLGKAKKQLITVKLYKLDIQTCAYRL